MSPELAPRAIALYKDAIRLIDQNPYDDVSLEMIENCMAMCYCFLEKIDDGIDLLRKNNIDGHNDCRIGLILSQCEGREEESLLYLSKALCSLYGNLQNICNGYVNAYRALGESEQIRDMLLMVYDFGERLRKPNTVSYTDRSNVRILTILAALSMEQGDRTSAYAYMKQAKQTAERFDSAPNYRVAEGKYYHKLPDARGYDDMGETAMDMIVKYIRTEKGGQMLEAIWEDVCNDRE